MTQREFTNICRHRGFERTGSGSYARCIGDAVLQTIDIRQKEYLCLDAPARTHTNKKSNCIIIGLSSLYSYWDECCFFPERYPNQIYRPNALIGQKPDIGSFLGFDDHCRIMLETGFSYLDSIVTQDALLQAKMKLDKTIDSRSTYKWIYSISVSEPLMVCERWDEAMYEVCRHYTHTWNAFHSNFDSLKAEGRWEEYFQKEEQTIQKLERTQFLWRTLLIEDKKTLNQYLMDNLLRNASFAEKHGIPIYQRMS